MLAYALLFGAIACVSYGQDDSSSAGGFPIGSSSVPSLVTAGPTQTKVPLYFPATETGQGLVASVINVDGCDTTYGLRCLARETFSGLICDPRKTAYFTYGPSSLGISLELTLSGITVTGVQSCSFAGKTEAVCAGTYSGSSAGFATTTSTTVTVTGVIEQVPITAGASKLAGQCTATEDNAAAPTAISEVYKVLVVPVAAALLGGALL